MLSGLLQAWKEQAGWPPRMGRRKIVPLGSLQTLEPRLLLAADAAVWIAPNDVISDHLTIQFPHAMRVGQLGNPVTVSGLGGATAGLLDVWIDWNGDGNWGGMEEHVASRREIPGAGLTLSVDVPSWANSGATAVRLRVTGPNGAADIERQATLTLLAPLSGGDFEAANVVDSSLAVQIASAADLDGDGDLDLLAATFFESGNIVWYENDGDQSFAPHLVTSTAWEATGVLAVDMNGDGHLDLVTSSLGTDTIAWYENDGQQQFTERKVTTTAANASGVFTADIDNDGDYDIVACSKGDSTVAWYENLGADGFEQHVVRVGLEALCAVSAADFDGDGDLDIAAAAFVSNSVRWFENDGQQRFLTEHSVSMSASGVRSIAVGDIDGDGDQDVAASCLIGNTVELYVNNGSGEFTRVVVNSNAPLACAVAMADLDGDGDLDLLAGSRGDLTVAWFENIGTTKFPRHVITTQEDQSRAVFAADVDGDGDLDVVSASKYGNRLAWYPNRIPPKYLNVTLESDSPLLSTDPQFSVTVTFSNPVSEFTAGHVTVLNGHVTGITGSGTTYTLSVVADHDGEVVVQVQEEVVTDSDGTGNQSATLTRQFTRVLPQLSGSNQPTEYVRGTAPLSLTPDIVVDGSRISGGRVNLIIPYLKSSLVKRDILDHTALALLGTATVAYKSNRLIVTVVLGESVTTEMLQAALRSLTFSTTKCVKRDSTRNVEVALVDNSGKAQASLTRTVQIRRARHARPDDL